MKPPFRIAILECDTPLTNTRSKYGGYGGVFGALLRASADELATANSLSSKHGLELTTWDVVNTEQYPKLDDVDAILLTGSSRLARRSSKARRRLTAAEHNSFDNDPWILRLVEFTKEVLAQDRVRIIGVCFGHQILGRALGAKVDRSDAGWEVSVCDVNLSAKGKELFKRDALHIFQMHRDIVYEYPDGVEELGWAPKCSVQGMYAKGRLISVQGHPEFTQPIVSEIVEARHGQGIFDKAQFEDAMARVGNQHDGVAVGAAFLRFLLED